MDKKKKYKKFLHNISYYKSILPKKYLPYYNEIESLYIDRKIEKQSEVTKLLDKLAGRGTAPKSAIKLIEQKYKFHEPIVGIKMNAYKIVC